MEMTIGFLFIVDGVLAAVATIVFLFKVLKFFSDHEKKI